VTRAFEWPQNNWLQRETPLGIPIFTPFRVRPWTENCLFAIDAQIVRMVYIGGLATNDPTLMVWTLYAPAPPERRGVELRHPWLTSRERFSATLLDRADRLKSAIASRTDGQSYSYRLRLIENVTGLSRRQLSEWLETSHTTLNEIARNERNPRTSLAIRIAALSRLMRSIAFSHNLDSSAIRKALTTRSLDKKSGLDYIIGGDYENAETAVQLALKNGR
jgi:DNA-binding XRE family transcriptional regulator